MQVWKGGGSRPARNLHVLLLFVYYMYIHMGSLYSEIMSKIYLYSWKKAASTRSILFKVKKSKRSDREKSAVVFRVCSPQWKRVGEIMLDKASRDDLNTSPQKYIEILLIWDRKIQKRGRWKAERFPISSLINFWRGRLWAKRRLWWRKSDFMRFHNNCTDSLEVIEKRKYSYS